MNRDDRKLWASARTLDDLCELTAMWLEGELEQTPGHLGPPCPETAEITNGRNVVAEEYAATMWPAKAERATSGAVA